MLRNRFVAVLAIAAFAGVLVTAGCVSAATKLPAAAATASARAAVATGGTANIMIYGVNTDGAYWHAIVSGVIGDYGPAVSIYPDGKGDPAHNSELDLRLTDGSFRLSIAALDKAFVKAGSHAPIWGIESTVAGLDAADLRRAARASTGVLAAVSASAARRHPADLPAAMAAYVTRALSREP
jgi:hypothetical protein